MAEGKLLESFSKVNLKRLQKSFLKLVIFLLEKLIHFYKYFISPFIGHRCRYYPSCSIYFLQAIKKKGVLKGVILGIWRILRCNPFSKGGFDEVN